MRKKLEQYYTKKEEAKRLLDFIFERFPEIKTKKILEPSAGTGSFIDNLSNFIAFDKDPKNSKIIETDFLKTKVTEEDLIIIGNPPFGKKGKLAIDFINKSKEWGNFIAFILPTTALRYSFQNKIDKSLKIIYQEELKENIFFTEDEKDFKLKTVFMIFVKKDSEFDRYKDLRKEKPIIEIEDLEIYQHNGTVASRKFLDKDWDIATYRQGYKDYSKRFYPKDKEFLKERILNTTEQFFFIKFKNEKSKKIFDLMDLEKLSQKNLRTPGFGKGDFIEYYKEIDLVLKDGVISVGKF